MTVPCVPELSGVEAIYVRSEDEPKEGKHWVSRPVFAWDKDGRPLVFASDRLQPASEAQFQTYKTFLNIRPFRALTDAADSVCDWLDEQLRSINIEEILRVAVEKAVAHKVNSSGKEN